MAKLGGLCLRLTSTILRVIELLASIAVLAIFSYFLAVLKDHDLPIAGRYKAVEGISGAGVLYGICGVIFTLFLAGFILFGFLGMVLDIMFAGAFLACAYFSRGGAKSCGRTHVETPLGGGNPNTSNAVGYGQNGFGTGNGENVTYYPNLRRACNLEKAAFACCVINVGLFLITAVLQVAVVRHHKREKRYGPSPANNYTSGAGRRPFWRRNKRNTRDAELATTGVHNKHEDGYGYAHPATTSTNY